MVALLALRALAACFFLRLTLGFSKYFAPARFGQDSVLLHALVKPAQPGFE